MKPLPKTDEYKNAYMILYLLSFYQLHFSLHLAFIAAPSAMVMRTIILMLMETTCLFLFKTIFCHELNACKPTLTRGWLKILVVEFPRIMVYVRLFGEMIELNTQIQLYYIDRISTLFFMTRYLFTAYLIVFLRISCVEQVYLVLCYALCGLLELRSLIPNSIFGIFYIGSLIAIPFAYIFGVKISRHPNENIDMHVENLNRMALILKTAFVNSLPKRLIPLVIKNERLPCEIAEGITTVYIHIKTDDSLLNKPESHIAKMIISKINFLICIFDFLAEMTCVEKIKSSYSYYMACSGAKTHFTGDSENEVTDEKQQFHLLATFCLACEEAAELMGITISTGITSGNAVVGVIGLEDSNVNLDIYGDTINLSARIARNAEHGIFFALKDSNMCKYFKISEVESGREELDFGSFKDLLTSCSYEDIKKEILAMKPGYCFGQKLVKNYKGKGEKQIIELMKTEFFEKDFQVVFARALQRLFDYSEEENDYDNEDFILFLNHVDSLKHRSQLNVLEPAESVPANSVEKCSLSLSYSDLINETMRLVEDIGKAERIILTYNRKLAAEEERIYQDELHLHMQNASGIEIQESLSQELFSRMYEPAYEQETEAQKLRDNLIDEAIDSDDDDSPTKFHPKWPETDFSTSTSAARADAVQEQHNSSSSIIENLLKPKLASFLEIARNTNEIRRGTHNSSSENQQSVNSKFSTSEIEHIETDTNDVQRQSDDRSETFVQAIHSNIKLTKGLKGLEHIAEAVESQQSQQKSEMEKQLDALYNQTPEAHDLAAMSIYKCRELLFLSTYCKKQLQEDLSYFEQFVCNQRPQISSFLLMYYISYQILIMIMRHFHHLPDFNFTFFGIPCAYRRFLLVNNWLLIANMSCYILFLRDYFARQRSFLHRPKRENAAELLETCGPCLSAYYRLFIIAQFILHSMREFMYFNIYERYHDVEVFDYFFPLIFMFIAVETAAFITVFSLLLSHRVAPILLLSSGLGAFFGAVIILVLFMAVRCSEFCFLQIAELLFIIAFTLPSLREHIFITQLNFKLSQQINNGRELLRLILPTITMDSLLAASVPDDLGSLIAQFPFLSGYLDQIIRLYSFEEVAAVTDTGVVPPSPLAFQSEFGKSTPRNDVASIFERLQLSCLRSPPSSSASKSPDLLKSERTSSLPASAQVKIADVFSTKNDVQPNYSAEKQILLEFPNVPAENAVLTTPASPVEPTPRTSMVSVQSAIDLVCVAKREINGKRGKHSTALLDLPKAPSSCKAHRIPSLELESLESSTSRGSSSISLNKPENDLEELFCGFLLFPNPQTLSERRPLINFKNAAYLNLDIANFTEFAAQITVEQTLQFLTDLYRLFDARIRESHDLIEIKISGDSYELMGLPCTLKRYEDSARIEEEFVFKNADLKEEFETAEQLRRSYDAVVCLIATGLGFIEDCKAVLKAKFPEFVNSVALRVGVAFGAVAGALLGDRLCRFDVFGSVSKEAERCQEVARPNSVYLSSGVRKIISEGERAFREYINRLEAQEEAGGETKLTLENEIIQFIEEEGCIVGIK